jgi:N-acetylmuramoyl-L-alanine amidase
MLPAYDIALDKMKRVYKRKMHGQTPHHNYFVIMMWMSVPLLLAWFMMAAYSETEKAVVCLDPGHPSEVNEGSTVQNGVSEVHLNWVVANEMKAKLEADGYRVVMTKSSEDEYVSNEERARIANESGAKLFFRIHCDSGAKDVCGMTFYYPDRQGEWDGRVGPPKEIIPECKRAAYAVHDRAMEIMDGMLKDRGVKTDNDTYVGSRQGGALRGSIDCRIPVVLVELCFLSNKDDASVMKNKEKRAVVVGSLVDGLEDYLSGPG